MSQSRHRPAGARILKPVKTPDRDRAARRSSCNLATKPSARGRPRNRADTRRTAVRAVLAVELTIQVTDGRRTRNTRIRIAGTAAKPRAMPEAAFPGIRERETVAAQVTRGVDPADLARILAAIAHPQRLTILFRLLACEATHQVLARATGLKAGPLYYHLRELRAAGLIGPKVRDLYILTPIGTRLVLAAIAAGRLCGGGH
jgi:DNA-binding transcriptional ArsR family regulator